MRTASVTTHMMAADAAHNLVCRTAPFRSRAKYLYEGDQIVSTTAPPPSATAPSPGKADPLRHYKHYQDSKHGPSSYAGGSSFMERVSEAAASGMGTVAFLIASSTVILAWIS